MLQWSILSTLSGSSAAISGSLLVRRKISSPLRARKALSSDRRAPATGGPASAEPGSSHLRRSGQVLDERIAGTHQTRIGEIEDGPKIAQSVFHGGAGQRNPGVGGEPA